MEVLDRPVLPWEGTVISRSEITCSQQLDKLIAAHAKLSHLMPTAPKDTANPFFKSRYADLNAVTEVSKEPLHECGLTLVQLPSADGVKVTITSILAHISGQWIASSLTLTAVKNDPQAIGSAITYGRRYAKSAILGIVQDDDDGNAASGRAAKVPDAAPKPQTHPPQVQAPQRQAAYDKNERYAANPPQRLVVGNVCRAMGIADEERMDKVSAWLLRAKPANYDLQRYTEQAIKELFPL